MRLPIAALLGACALAPGVDAVTLTITPDEPVYEVGEQIVVSVVGDSAGALETAVFGRILFDAKRADYASSSQQNLTSFGGAVTWALGPLSGGEGFGDAFNQVCCFGDAPVDAPLFASVVLRATSPGTLEFSWDPETLDFFDVHRSFPAGVSVTIVPEPGTALLLALGLSGIALRGAKRPLPRGSPHAPLLPRGA